MSTKHLQLVRPPAREHLRALMKRNNERKDWEARHPELAAAWTEALAEDEERAEAKARAEEAAARERHLRQTAPDRLIALGAPRRAVEVWQAGAKPTKALRAVEAMFVEGRTFALLTGDTGVGKTVAAVHGMALRLLDGRREDIPCLFVRAQEGAVLGMYDSADRKLAAQMREAGLLVLDDLGMEFLSEGSIWRSILDDVIDVRYGERAPTIITTNLNGEAFKERYGSRIADRIRHAGVVEGCGTGTLRERGRG